MLRVEFEITVFKMGKEWLVEIAINVYDFLLDNFHALCLVQDNVFS